MTLLAPKKTLASADGAELAYWVRRADPASRQFLLLIHGGASNHTRWTEFVETSSLTGEWNVIVPDMRGNAASMTRSHVNLQTWCSDLRTLLSAEQAEKVVICGHSLGAQIAVHFANRYQDMMRGLILIDPIFQSSLQGRSLWIRRCRWLVHGVVAVLLGLNALGLRRRSFEVPPDLRVLDEKTREEIRGAESFEEIAKRYSALGPILRNMPLANYLRQALASVTPLPLLATINTPVLAMLCGGTTVGDLEVNRKEVSEFPINEIVILDANHWPLTETPAAVRAAIDEWVMRTYPSAAGQLSKLSP